MYVPLRALVVLAMVVSFNQFLDEPSFADPPVLEAPCVAFDPGTYIPEGEAVPDTYDDAPDSYQDADGDGEPTTPTERSTSMTPRTARTSKSWRAPALGASRYR